MSDGVDIGFRIEAVRAETLVTNAQGGITTASVGDLIVSAVYPNDTGEQQSLSVILPADGALSIARKLVSESYKAQAWQMAERPHVSDR